MILVLLLCSFLPSTFYSLNCYTCLTNNQNDPSCRESYVEGAPVTIFKIEQCPKDHTQCMKYIFPPAMEKTNSSKLTRESATYNYVRRRCATKAECQSKNYLLPNLESEKTKKEFLDKSQFYCCNGNKCNSGELVTVGKTLLLVLIPFFLR
ncbi:hypothetical protein SNEBB_008524 [Seison nebaliae]|nr:hypothetical protein SNEBB_008524 [Seison nebaliae]